MSGNENYILPTLPAATTVRRVGLGEVARALQQQQHKKIHDSVVLISPAA